MILSSNVSGKLSWRGTLAMAFLAVIVLPYWSLAQSTAEPNPNPIVQSNADNDHPKAAQPEPMTTRTIKYKLVDGTTGTPLQGMEFTFGTWRKVPDKLSTYAPSREISFAKSAAGGIVDITVREGESPYLKATPPGWFLPPLNYIEKKDGDTTTLTMDLPGMPAPDSTQPHVIKLWPGTEVGGTLLWPDGKPAANIPLNAGVYINHQTWKERLGMDQKFESWDHGEIPNWSEQIVTDAKGRFRVTVPPAEARSWLRIGTTSLSFGSFVKAPDDPILARQLEKCIPLEYQIGGHAATIAVIDLIGGAVGSRTNSSNADRVELTLQLMNGVTVRGKVVDADGTGLRDVRLTTSGAHGPHSGRSTTSGDRGRFEFMAMRAGSLTVHPDARFREKNGQVRSRDVQAVFASQSFTIPHGVADYEITIPAEPPTEVVFDWIDRREDKTQPIASSGAFRVRGSVRQNQSTW